MDLHPMRVDELSSTHLMQSTYWANLKSGHGWSAYAFRLGRSSLLVLCRRFLRCFTLAYVPFGPDQIVSLRELSLALSPFLPRGTFAIRYDLPYGDLCDASGAVSQANSVQPDATVLISLDDGYPLVRERYRKRAKRQLSRANGVLVSSLWKGSEEEFEQFFALYEETARRDGFSSRSKEYIRDVLRIASGGVQADLFLVWRQKTLVGGAILLHGKRDAIYLYGASARIDGLSVGYFLQDVMIRFCCERHISTYDLDGVSAGSERGAHLESLDLFKTSFGGELVMRRPTMDWPLQRVVYGCFMRMDSLRYRIRRGS